jgi:hypothetical protein
MTNRAKDNINGPELEIDDFFAPFPWAEWRECSWEVIRREQEAAHQRALEDLNTNFKHGGGRWPYWSEIYMLCRSEIENWKISLMDPAYAGDWHSQLGIECEIIDLEQHLGDLRELMQEWRKKHGIKSTLA